MPAGRRHHRQEPYGRGTTTRRSALGRDRIAASDLTTLQLAVPAVDPLLHGLRDLVTDGGSVLDPAHISFGYPWLPPATAAARIDDVAEALRDVAPAEVLLAGPQRFPPDSRDRITIHLAPRPATPITVLARRIAEAAGHHPDHFTPHCSLVRLPAGAHSTIAEVERRVAPSLPIATTLRTIELRIRDEHGWSLARRLTLMDR